MKLTKEQKKALAERIHERATKEAKEYNDNLKTPDPTPEQNKMVDEAFEHFKAIPPVFFNGLFSHNSKPTSRQELLDCIIDTLDTPPQKRVMNEKTIYNRLILMDMKKFNSIDEVEKAFDPFLK